MKIFLSFKAISLLLHILLAANYFSQESLNIYWEKFQHPPTDCWPHTRWWWPGNATTKENITYELEQMRSHGITGAEQITMPPLYERGNIEYLSDEYLDLISHTVEEAKRLQMQISFNFGGPGWIIGGNWIADKDRSKDMIPTFIDVSGPGFFNNILPAELIQTNRSWEIHRAELTGEERLLAVVACRHKENVLDPSSLIVITEKVKSGILEWEIPDGNWRISCFWLSTDKSHNTVNHFDKDAMEKYCSYLGDKYKEAVGKEFGKTVESFFCDSFELPYQPSGIKWSDGLFDRFNDEYGYELIKYLPAVWWEVENITPKIRFDVNQFLGNLGLETFYEPFLNWCSENGVNGRIQTYGFETDNIKSAGLADIPEMEITPGEKDQHPWYDTRIGPKKYVASGAHIYGKKIISAEAHTFLHWERYRSTLEEIKISTDGFLRSGANKFYNHGYSSSLERDLAPSRRMPWAPQLNPTNVWWKYYPLLAEYVARCSYILRQGEFIADIAVYSPLANQWTKNVLNARRWTRDFDWGELGDLLISNGYDFDILNDEAIQNIAVFDKESILVGKQNYKLLILPNIESVPLKSMLKISDYVKQGGTVIAIDQLPQYSTGYMNYKINDKKVQSIAAELFQGLSGNTISSKIYGNGKVFYLKKVIHRPIWWDKYSSVFDPFIRILNNCIEPDFKLDLAYEGLRKNEGLTFLHRKMDEADLYFVANIQDKCVKSKIKFRVKEKQPWLWNPYDGSRKKLYHYNLDETGIILPLNLSPWESAIIVFDQVPLGSHVISTNADKINYLNEKKISAEVSRNGLFYFQFKEESVERMTAKEIFDIPSEFIINGTWELTLENRNFSKINKQMKILESWSNISDTKHFSGTGIYQIYFDLPEDYFNPELKLSLDLGKIGNIGEVFINGKNCGTIWMKNQKSDITDQIIKGRNLLQIHVTNTNINRVSSFKEIAPVPEEIKSRFGDVKSDTIKPREFGFNPLPPSGLMGPVKIIPSRTFILAK